MTRKTSWTAALLGAAGLLLASCGGGGGGDVAAITPAPAPSPAPAPAPAPAGPPLVSGSGVPVSATTSADGAFAFVASLAAAPDDRAEPLVLGNATLATSNTDEARALR